MSEAKGGFVGKSMLRREDQRLLTGRGEYVADLKLPGMLHAAFVRSQVAHARIRSVDLSRARTAPGVVYAIAGPDLMELLPPVPDTQLALPRKWTTRVQHTFLNPQQSLLAFDKVRHVGEAIAIVVAETRYQAEDAAELVEVDLEPLPVVVDPEAGLGEGAAVLHEQYGTNLIGDFAVEKGDTEAALAAAPHRLKRRFYHHRYAAIPMECRGVVGSYDARTDSVNIWSSCQVVHWLRREASTVLNMPEARIRCVALDVGGGFGVKGHVYPEDLLIPFVAREIGRPVKWIEDRHEHFVSACHSRDQIHDVEVGFGDDGRLLAFRDSFYVDCGAWNPIGSGIAYNTAVHLPGPYKFDNFSVRSRIVVTNKVPNAPYRGAGRPEASFAMERAMDLIAAELKLEPAEVRRCNLIPASEMPYHLGIPYRDGESIVYDSGDYPESLRLALEAIGGVEPFREQQRAARAGGRYLGLGLGCYVEGTGVGPFESATVRIDPTGKLYVAGGACPQGQGMETIFAQIVADEWKVEPKDVVIALADTSAISIGFGTIASRSTVTLSGAIHRASEPLREKVFAIAANMLECSAGDLELRSGGVGILGVPGNEVSLAKIAKAARPGWDHGRPDGMPAGLEETAYFEPQTVTWAYATHAAILEVDPQIGRIDIKKYVIVHDCGTVVNPMLVDGQIHGGAIQGLGGAMLEELTYDSDGQLLVGSFMDYLVPGASDAPHLDLIHMHSPSPLNPLGVKGVGEGSAIAPPVVIANAVADALSHLKVEFNATPIKPEQIVRAVLNGPSQP
ncbi:MAG TPA: xanthine dehydrogenase family protein molybdopterin-binding subunit [Pseudolabrys sp.]|uniref:xanthine dehydrogenase family protein molybdopterin-binding subunit n=1 Tax=Pseudolabrys sp. TaxID=1960880 RepID=UPI002DDCD5F7|nr:xanthine dehydrogenase family protein molybdopterin-binding subunit [Pseudolabrys sp.]HEV2627667.1 xanthine dehydrogenase family protein molybdopterin-binding subunit [Pseudolabrys sp.]